MFEFADHGYGRTTKVDLQQNNDISVSARKFCNARQEPDVLELMIGAPVIVLKRLGVKTFHHLDKG